MPENSIYATPLAVVVKDRRLGGFLKPIVGTGAIDLTTKIPWCEDTYIAPATQIFMEQDTEQQQIMEAVDKEQSNLRAGGSPGGDTRDDMETLISQFEASHQRDPVSGALITHEDDEFELIEVETDEEVDSDDDDYEEAKARMIADIQADKGDNNNNGGEEQTKEELMKKTMERVPTRRVKKKKLIRKKFDDIARKVKAIRDKRKANLLADDYIVNPEPPEIDDVRDVPSHFFPLSLSPTPSRGLYFLPLFAGVFAVFIPPDYHYLTSLHLSPSTLLSSLPGLI